MQNARVSKNIRGILGRNSIGQIDVYVKDRPYILGPVHVILFPLIELKAELKIVN